MPDYVAYLVELALQRPLTTLAVLIAAILYVRLMMSDPRVR